MPDELELAVGSTRISAWEAITVSRALDTGADAFSLSAAFDPSREELRQAFKPFGYPSATVSIDGERILTGRIESVSPSLSEGDRMINVQGRSLTGPLLDCAIDGVGFEFSGLTLRKIAQKVVAPFGLAVKVGWLGAASADKALGEVRADPGERAFDFLAGLAKDIGALLTNDETGALIIASPNPGAAPVASIVEGVSAIMEISAGYDGTARFSRYKVLLQQDGAEAVSGVAADAGVPVYRPRIDTDGQGPASGATASAEWARALALAEAVQVSAVLSGWRGPGGALWEPGQIVTLKAPSVFIDRETPFMVVGVDLTLDGSGRKAALRLVLPATYTGKMPGSYPWA